MTSLFFLFFCGMTSLFESEVNHLFLALFKPSNKLIDRLVVFLKILAKLAIDTLYHFIIENGCVFLSQLGYQ